LPPYIGIQVVPKCGVPTWKVFAEAIMANIGRKNFEYMCATCIDHMHMCMSKGAYDIFAIVVNFISR